MCNADFVKTYYLRLQAQDVVNKVNAASSASAFSSEVRVSKKFREGRSK